MKNIRKGFRGLAAGIFLILLLTGALQAAAAPAGTGPGTSKAWQQTLDERTGLMWVDAQILGKMVLNARARLTFTWLPRSLLKRLEKDPQVDEWVVNGLSYYHTIVGDTQQKVKGRDIMALNYRTEKSWTFDPVKLTFGDYQVKKEDLLGHKDFLVIGDLPSGTEGTLYLCVPTLKPGQTLPITLGPDAVEMILPKR
ncbi:MAG: hypothetical protein K6E38_03525 [Fretibacterium sp.]|nr:hypothetical protein [Fretibacterium sp.]